LRAPVDHIVGARRGERRCPTTPLADLSSWPDRSSMPRLLPALLRRVGRPGPIRLREGEAEGRRTPALIEADRKRLRHPQPACPVTLVTLRREVDDKTQQLAVLHD